MFTVKEAPEGKYTPQVTLSSSTDSAASVKEIAKGGQAFEYQLDTTEVSEDGKVKIDAVESPISSREQLLQRLQEAEEQSRKELEDLYGLDEAAEAKRQEALAAMQQGETEGEQEQPAEELTAEERAQIRTQAVQDAIAAGRQQVLANNPQALIAQYNAAEQQAIANYQAKAEQVRLRHDDWDQVFQAVAQQDVPFDPRVTQANLCE